MFHVLSKVSPTTKPVFNAQEAFLAAIADMQCNVTSLVDMTECVNSTAVLRGLHKTITKYGATEALMSFANYDGSLTAAIPAFEHIMPDNITSRNAALNGVTESIKEVAQRWWDAFKAHIVKYKKWYGGYMALSTFFQGLQTVGVAILAMTVPACWPMFVVALVGLALDVWLTKAIKKAKSTPLAVKQALSLKLPAEQDGLQKYKDDVAAIFKKQGIDIDNLGEMSDAEKASGKDAGYTAESVKETIKATSEAFEELKRCTYVPDMLEKLGSSKEAETEAGRAALTFVAGMVTKAMGAAGKAIATGASTIEQFEKAAAVAKKQSEKKD